MTVPVPGSLVYTYSADDSTTSFSYPVRFLDKAEIVVILREGLTDTVQVLGTDYTISGSSWPTGGSIVFGTAPASGKTVVIYRNTVAKQLVDLENTQRNDANAVETQLDRLAMVQQDQGRLVGTAIQPGSAGSVPTDGDDGNVLIRDPSVPGGSKWVHVTPGLGDVIAANNLADLDDKAVARNNLGLKGGATLDAPSDPDLSNDTDKLALRGDVKTYVDTGTVYKVADRTALKAVDTGAHSTVYLLESGREGQFVWSSADLSTLVTADTEEGVYIAPTSDDTGASGAWVRIHDGELRLEMFGATAITDWDAPEDSTTALAGWASLANLLPFNTVLGGFYRTTSALSFTLATLNIEGIIKGFCGFLFDDCDGIQLTHMRRDGFGLKNFTFLTNANNTRTAFSYTGGTVTADAPYRRIDACAWMGLDRYLRNRFGTAAVSYTNGWLTEIDLDEGDTTFINDPVIIGPEEDRLSGFDEATTGINFVDSSNVVVRFPQIYFKKTGIKGRGTSENLEVRGGTLVANYDGIDVETDTLGNDHNIIGVHISSINSNINLGVGGTATATMHNVEGCLLFCRNSNDPVSDGFTYIKAKSTVQIQNNFFFTSSGIDPVGDNHVSIDLQGGNKSIVSGNIFYTQNKLVKIASGVSGTLITDNTTVDSGSTIAVTPVDDAGASTRYGQNYGDRYSLWPVATPYGMSVGAGGLFPQTNGGCNLGKNAQRFGVGFFSGAVYPGGSNFIQSGSGSPEGVLTAPIGSMWLRTDGGAGTTLYVKESGAGNTGWVAK